MTPLLERDIYLFDLDNTLYRPENQIIEQIILRFRDYISDAMSLSPEDADALCTKYYLQYGGTLRGMQLHHPEIDLEALSFYAHNVDLTGVDRAPALEQALLANNKSRFVFTNSPRPYAERVLEHLGLRHCFDGVFSVEQTDYKMKPHPHAFKTIGDHFGFECDNAVLFDDQTSNIGTAREMGMRTVLVNRDDLSEHNACYRTEQLANFVDHLNQMNQPKG
ncbi:pyrimidine 5'-nucleotidase [Ferrimonas marina]|uniref:Putative hydrolase of the HAD superfamily n=1 Tax=Ferrimonas marina TaxID=299255 RepID=A0A1M5NPR9_9GAMM|nr:pyrimidine 5'-nucleotidase [Ferrimonas marina]SHG91541.1 putative hydrolase of the HAD superfamily [Ferrimonas marina]